MIGFAGDLFAQFQCGGGLQIGEFKPRFRVVKRGDGRLAISDNFLDETTGKQAFDNRGINIRFAL